MNKVSIFNKTVTKSLTFLKICILPSLNYISHQKACSMVIASFATVYPTPLNYKRFPLCMKLNLDKGPSRNFIFTA